MLVKTKSEVEKHAKKFEKLSNQALTGEFQNILGDLTTNVIRLSALYKVMQDRGLDTSWIPNSLKDTLVGIAYGRIHPEAYKRFSGTRVGQKIFRLPFHKQEELSKGAKVKVLTGKNGDAKSLDPLEMNMTQVKLAFDHNSIRSLKEQKEYRELSKEIDKTTREAISIRVNKAKKQLVVKFGDEKVEIPREDLMKYLKKIM